MTPMLLALAVAGATPTCPPSAHACYQQQVQVAQVQAVFTQAVIVQPLVAAVQVQVVPQYVQPQLQLQPAAVPAQPAIPQAQSYVVPQVQAQVVAVPFAVQTYASASYGCAVPSASFAFNSVDYNAVGVRTGFHGVSATNVVVVENARRNVLVERRARATAVQVNAVGGARVNIRQGILGRKVIRIR